MADANLDIRVTSKGIKEAQLALQKLGINADKAEDAVKQYKEETKKNEKAQNQYRKQQEKVTTQVSKAAQVHKQARGARVSRWCLVTVACLLGGPGGRA